MKVKREKQLYDLSDRLGQEIMVLEVGRQLIVPRQIGTGAHVRTERGANWEFMQAAVKNPEAPLVWTHTHPGFGAFFSSTDEDGARRYHSMVADTDLDRPITAVVLGKEGQRHVEVIDNAWIAAHPQRFLPPLKPEPIDSLRWRDLDGYDGYDLFRPRSWATDLDRFGDNWERTPSGNWRLRTPGLPPPVPEARRRFTRNTIKRLVKKICEAYGTNEFLELLDEMRVISLVRDKGGN